MAAGASCWPCQRYGAGVEGRSSQLASDLIGRAHEEVSARAVPNRFVDLLEAGVVPRERLTWLAGEQFRIAGSDQRSFALLAALPGTSGR